MIVYLGPEFRLKSLSHPIFRRFPKRGRGGGFMAMALPYELLDLNAYSEKTALPWEGGAQGVGMNSGHGPYIAGVGAALVDLLVEESNAFVAAMGSDKGGMTLVELQTIE